MSKRTHGGRHTHVQKSAEKPDPGIQRAYGGNTTEQGQH